MAGMAISPGSAPPPTSASPLTLAIDIGGSGLKASVLTPDGTFIHERVRIPTTFPCPPAKLLDDLERLVAPLPTYDRVSAGFPGMVRGGLVLTASNFATEGGPGTKVDPELVRQWERFDLAGALAQRLGRPARVVNDADMQGSAVVSGKGLEMVVTLGTGVGTALFHEGRLAPHLEVAHHPFRKGETYDEQLGDVARREIGSKRWNRRVALAVENLDRLTVYDRLYIGGGNSHRVTAVLGPKVTLVDNTAGIVGGVRIWDIPIL
ncbi:MAG: polyphosphate glucokinase [Acidimicrobiia bacterium]|jgi:polyphosphate glucokinase|nr:polyphosphate glucokinase [Acidimicrobiia bacterium]